MILATAFLMGGVYQLVKPAIAEPQAVEEVCRENLNFALFVEAISKEGTVRPLNDAELAYLLKTKGEPPVEKPYSINLVRVGDDGMLIIEKGNCIVAKLGPMPAFLLDGILGATKADTNG